MELRFQDLTPVTRSNFYFKIIIQSRNWSSILKWMLNRGIETPFSIHMEVCQNSMLKLNLDFEIEVNLEIVAWPWRRSLILKLKLHSEIEDQLFNRNSINQSLISKSKINFEIEDLFQNWKKFLPYIIYEIDTKSYRSPLWPLLYKLYISFLFRNEASFQESKLRIRNPSSFFDIEVSYSICYSGLTLSLHFKNQSFVSRIKTSNLEMKLWTWVVITSWKRSFKSKLFWQVGNKASISKKNFQF